MTKVILKKGLVVKFGAIPLKLLDDTTAFTADGNLPLLIQEVTVFPEKRKSSQKLFRSKRKPVEIEPPSVPYVPSKPKKR